MSICKLISKSREETIRFGTSMAKYLKPGDIVCLFGDLGAGKTTFVQGLAKGFKINPDKVCSPTFVLMNIYKGNPDVYHFDLYRTQSSEDLFGIGYDEFFYGQGISVVEWSEKLAELTPKEYIKVMLKHKDENSRVITLTVKGKSLVDRWKNVRI